MSLVWIKAIVLTCVFGAVLLAVESLISWAATNRDRGRAINLRLQLIGEGRTRAETMSLLRKGTGALASELPVAFGPLANRFERLVTAARIRAPAMRVLVILAVIPAAVFMFILLILLAGGGSIGPGRIIMIATFAIVTGGVLPLMVLQARANRTKRKMQDQFPVALDVFVRGLRAGHPIAAALDLLTVEMPDPIGSEFGLVVDEVTYGADLRDALGAMAERWDMDDIRMFVVSLSVQSETGGNLAEILENLSRVIRERASMMLKVRALSSEGRMSAIMLTALPILSFVFLFLLNPAFFLDVADDPAFVPGFAAMAIIYLIGFWTIRRMVDLKV